MATGPHRERGLDLERHARAGRRSHGRGEHRYPNLYPQRVGNLTPRVLIEAVHQDCSSAKRDTMRTWIEPTN